MSGFKITKIVIVQSLEPQETQTGRHLYEYISAELTGQSIGICLCNCTNYVEFEKILDRLAENARLYGEIPILHVECHGCKNEGLEFENGSTLSWPRVAEKLLSLNVACGFNLLAVFSACFGGYFLGQIKAINPAPCWGMVAPTQTVDPAEIMNAFRTFYSTLLRTMNVGIAIREIAQTPLQKGYWFGKLAEYWFEELVIGYVIKYCTRDAIRLRARRINQELKHKKLHKSVGGLKRLIRQRNRKSLLDDYFQLYFMVDSIPQNSQRFIEVRVRLEKKLAKLRSTGRYTV